MKKIALFIAAVLISMGSWAQEEAETPAVPLKFDRVIDVEGFKAQDIYRMLKQWAGRTFNDPSSVLTFDDGRSEVIVKPRFVFKTGNLTWRESSGYVSYMVSIRVKDNRFKVVAENFVHTSTSEYDHWSNGIVYASDPTKEQLKAAGWSATRRTQYRWVHKKILPLGHEEWAKLMLSIEGSFLKSLQQQIDDDNW